MRFFRFNLFFFVFFVKAKKQKYLRCKNLFGLENDLQLASCAHDSLTHQIESFSYAQDHDVFVNLSRKILKAGKKRGRNIHDRMIQKYLKNSNKSKRKESDSIPDRHSFLYLLNVVADDFMFDVVQHTNTQENPKKIDQLRYLK